MHYGWIEGAPAAIKAAKCGFGLATTFPPIDRLSVGLELFVVALARLLEKVAHLVHPTALMQNSGVQFGWQPLVPHNHR